MTQMPSDLPPPPPMELNYQAPQPHKNAATLIKLAAIFNFVMAGLDGLAGLFYVGAAVVIPIVIDKSGGPPPPGPGGIDFKVFMWLSYGAYAFLSLSVGAVKLIGALKLWKHRRGAWGWGLAASIVGFTQIWCSLLCIIPLAVGIFTMVALVTNNAREYLAQEAAKNDQPAGQP